ncbi:MAG: PIN domain-containing protein [Desulfovermiculus sp.]|nr:PIN domain-containing protein [Desulfovermiculus sp.]
MRVVIDLNVILDVVQERQGLHASSGAVLQLVVEDTIQAVIPGHCLTTLYYITTKHRSKEHAEFFLDWMLKYFDVGIESITNFIRARSMQFTDFEDAVVASVAETEECHCIITRNIRDFKGSSIQALTPEEFLVQVS